MATDISKLGVKAKWQDLTEGMVVAGAGTSKEFLTGEWTSVKPEIDWEKCKQCLLCAPACPDSCIPVADKKRADGEYQLCSLRHCWQCAGVKWCGRVYAGRPGQFSGF